MRAQIAALACAATLAARTAEAAIAEHRVAALPGWAGPLPSAIYSGYITVQPTPPHTERRYLHYVFIESFRAPKTDPLMLWVNGGPGSSSLKGVFSQLGPFQLNDASYPASGEGNLTLFPNPSTWNRVANILYLEQPAAVGFSYCNKTKRARTGKDNCDHTDVSVAHDNLEFMEQWLKAYPEFASNPLYLCGVSYGGIYVPSLAQLVMQDAPHMNLMGVAVGNPSFRWGDEDSFLSSAPQSVQSTTKNRMDMLGGHGQFSPSLYKQILSTCTFFNNDTVVPASECEALLKRMKAEVGGYDLYNIYDQCKLAGDDIDLSTEPSPAEATLESLGLGSGSGSSIRPHDDRGGQCGQERALVSWANEPSVRSALHVLSAAELGPYTASSHLNYGRDVHDTYSIYEELLKAGKRVLVYSGDVDNCLPWTGSLQWVSLLGIAETEPWRPWTLHGGAQVSGYVIAYGDQLTFATVRGAGHMVPEFRPAEAYVLMESWFAKQPLPGYKRNATRAKTDDKPTFEAPEPYEFIHGQNPTALPPRPASPDPLVRYTWSDDIVSTTLQQVAIDSAIAVHAEPASAFEGLETLTGGGSVSLLVKAPGWIRLDYGLERPAWFEGVSADLHTTGQAHLLNASISEYDEPYDTKEEPVKTYGHTFRLETQQ